MTLARGLPVLVLAVLVTVTAAQAAGAWIAETDAPTLRQRGWRYPSKLLTPRPTTPVAGSGITRVSWQYHYEPWDPALQVALCAAGACIDASGERGWSDAFSGLPVTSGFRFYFMVAGQGMLAAPLRGGALQLVVNFE